jgi:L-alanine-DL-glutamate epimerase-like enolase superfamily enzyme
MTRRDYLKTSGGAALAMQAVHASAADDSAQLQDEVIRLYLKHKWTTVMSTSTYRDTVHVQYGRDGLVGYGEGAPIPRYNETPQTAKYAVETVRGLLEEAETHRRAVRGEGRYRYRVDGLEWQEARRASVPLLRAGRQRRAGHHVFHRHRRSGDY